MSCGPELPSSYYSSESYTAVSHHWSVRAAGTCERGATTRAAVGLGGSDHLTRLGSVGYPGFGRETSAGSVKRAT